MSSESSSGLEPSGWVPKIMLSVLAFVSGMLCLVHAQRLYTSSTSDNSGRPRALGIRANLVFAFVSAILAIFVLLTSRKNAREFFDLFEDGAHRRTVLPWIVLFGVMFFAGNALYFDGLVSAPNAGYARALMTVEVIAVTLLSALIFGARVQMRQGVGVVLVTAGSILVSL